MSRYLSNYTGPQVDTAIGKSISGQVPIELGVPDPEGTISADFGTFGYGSDGSLWYKYSGTSEIGWSQVVLGETLSIVGGSF